MQGNRNFADLGKRRADIFMRAQQVQVEMYEQLLPEFSSNPKAAAGAGDAAGGVRDPLKTIFITTIIVIACCLKRRV